MKILILGTGNAQIDAIKYLKENGHYVYAISYIDEKTDKNLVDHFEIIDILDKQKAAAFVFNHKIDVVYSVGSDIAMPTICYISEKLNLPCFVNQYTAELMQHKEIFRNFLKANGLCHINYVSGRLLEDVIKWNYFPAVIKPVDNQGQRGIRKINSTSELKAFFPETLSFSRSQKVILEEYIPGVEVSVNSYLHNENFLYHFISKREILENAPGGIVKSHTIPANLTETLERKIICLVEKTIKQLKILNGPVYFQIKLTPEEDVYIIEGAPRLDGCHMWRLIEAAYGINLLDLTFNKLLNLPQEYPKKELLSAKKTFRLEFLHEEPKKVFDMNHYKELSHGSYLEFYYKDGDVVRPINGYYEKVGYRILIK